jgi:hypothetical protein
MGFIATAEIESIEADQFFVSKERRRFLKKAPQKLLSCRAWGGGGDTPWTQHSKVFLVRGRRSQRFQQRFALLERLRRGPAFFFRKRTDSFTS